MPYINTHEWNLERWFRCAYLQGRDRDADMGNRHVGTWEKGRWGELEIGTDINTPPCVNRASRNCCKHRQLSSVLCDDLYGWDGVAGGRARKGYMFIYNRFSSIQSRN